jgi:uncharacterized membrane protein
MKVLKSFSLLILVTVILTTFSLTGVVLAQDGEDAGTDNATPEVEPISEETPEPEPVSGEPEEPVTIAAEEEEEETITLSSEYPEIEAIATGSFEYTVKLEYKGEEDRIFDLNLTVPTGWNAYITPQYESMRIPSIKIEGSQYSANSKSVKVQVTPPTWPLAEPDEYTVTLEASSDEVVGEIELTAKITAKYVLQAEPTTDLYNTKVKAGKDNTFTIDVTNVGTDSISNITFDTNQPEGWEIKFTPEKIDLLEIVTPKTVNVNIKPPPKTVAGDYMVTLRVNGKEASADRISVRVTVETPTVWGWVGVAIIVIVIIGLIAIFMRFGRR